MSGPSPAGAQPSGPSRRAFGPRPGTRLFVVASALAVLLFIAGLALAFRNQSSDRRRVRAEMELLARAAGAEADRFLRDRIALLQVIAASPQVRSADPAQMIAAFATLPAAEPGLTNLGWADSSGLVLARTPPPLPMPLSAADREYFRSVITTGQPFVSPAIETPRNPNVAGPLIALAVPTRDDAGTLTGVLSNTISLDQLERTLSEFRQPGGAALLVVDRADNIIVDTASPATLANVSDHPLVRRAREGAPGVVDGEAGPRGDTDRLAAFALVETGSWMVFLDRPTGAAYAPARRALLAEVGALLGVTLVGLGGACVAAVRLNRHAAERRRAEEALSSSRDQLDAILQGVADAITVQDQQGHIVYANDAAARLIGYQSVAELMAAPPAEFLQRFEILDRDGLPFPLTRLPGRRALAGEVAPETIIRYRRRTTGAELWSVVKATPIFAASGEVQLAVTIFSDISEQRREEDRRRFLTDAGSALASSLDYAETLGRLARLAVPVLADFCVVFALEDGDIRRLEAVHGDPAKQPLLDELRRFTIDPDSDAPIARVLRSGVAELSSQMDDTDLRGISSVSDHHAALSALSARLMITAPLLARGGVFGGISMVMAESGRRYGPDDLALVEDLARRASVAVDNARLFAEARAAEEQAHQRAEQLSLLAAAARVFAEASPHYPDVLDVIAREITHTTGDGCIIRLVSEPSRALAPVAVSHPDPEAETLARSIVMKEGGGVGRLPEEVQEHGVPLLLHVGQGLEGAITPTFRAYVERFGVQSLLVLPLMAQNRVIGVMSVSRERPRPPLTADDARFLDDLAGRAALAIDNALLYAAEARARERAEAAAGRIARLQAVTAALAEALTPDQVADVVVQQGRATLGAHAGGIVLLTPDGAHLEILTAFGYPDNILEQYRRYPVTDPLPAGEAVRSRRPVWLSSREQIVGESPPLRPVIEQIETNAIAALPLIAGPRVIGAMLLSFDRAGAFSEDDQAFMLALARQCAQALERARLFVAEHDARAEAEAANRAKDDFLSTLSHELRTPLTSMLGWTRLLRSRRLDPSAVAEGLETIERNARLQAGLIEDLLDVSRIITGKLRLDIEPVDLPALLYSAVESARPAAEARRVALSFSAAAGVTMVEGDSARLRQVFDNLLSNAIKFTAEEGEVEVRLAPEGRDACVTVRDTGAGIAPEFLPHIFERFRQADASSTRVFGGLGLGLSIVRYIVDQHGGAIRVASEGEGKGATFTVSLPVRGAELDVDVRGMLQLGPDGDASLLAGLLVLVVEDDADTRHVLTATLEGYGAEVIAAGSTPEARVLLAREQPDVILSDIAMPGDDGYALIAAVRAMQGEMARVPVIAVTAYAGTENRERLLAAGYNLHIAKPVEPADLVATVARLAGRVERT